MSSVNSLYTPLPENSRRDFSNFFSLDYVTCCDRFIRAASEAGGEVFSHVLEKKGPREEQLSINVAYFGERNAEKVILHTSGIHGVEGFAGSAVQCYILAHLPKRPPNTAFIFIHAINPFGMAYYRRLNENNVDLNRNFIYYKDGHIPPQDEIREFESILHPYSAPKTFGRIGFLFSAVRSVASHGFRKLKKVIGDGQYIDKMAILYGGERLEEGPRFVIEMLENDLRNAKKVYALDFHTAAPGNGHNDLIIIARDDEDRLKNQYGNRVSALGYANNNSTFSSAIGRLVSKTQNGWAAIQEIPTIYSNNPALSDLVNITYAVEENQEYHYFTGTPEERLTSAATQNYLSVFYVDTNEWKENVIRSGYDGFEKGLKILSI